MYRFGSVTGIPLVLPVLHGREPEPSSFGRRCRRRRRMIAAFQRKAEAPKGPDVTYSVFHELSDLSSGLSPSSFLRKEPALRDVLLYHQCCMAESQSPPFQGKGAKKLRRSRHHNPQPEGLSNLRTLRTFGAKAPSNFRTLSAEGAVKRKNPVHSECFLFDYYKKEKRNEIYPVSYR